MSARPSARGVRVHGRTRPAAPCRGLPRQRGAAPSPPPAPLPPRARRRLQVEESRAAAEEAARARQQARPPALPAAPPHPPHPAPRPSTHPLPTPCPPAEAPQEGAEESGERDGGGEAAGAPLRSSPPPARSLPPPLTTTDVRSPHKNLSACRQAALGRELLRDRAAAADARADQARTRPADPPPLKRAGCGRRHPWIAKNKPKPPGRRR